MKSNYVVAVMGLSVLIMSCNSKKAMEKSDVVYPTQEITLVDRTLMSDFAASITGCQTVEIRPQVNGMLTKINIRDGASVHKDQVLFEIDPAQFQAAYDVAQANVHSAEAAVSTAQLVLDSNMDLYKEQVISEFELNTAKNDLAEAKAKLNLAKAELDRATTNLSYTQVKSPVNGVTSMIPYRVGALVGTNIAQPLVTVSDDGNVYCYFSMSETQMLNFIQKYGSMANAMAEFPEVELRMSNGEMYQHKGRIDAVSGTVNSTTGAVSLRAVFPNPDRLLRDGGTGSVIIPSEYKGCVVIPKVATYELQDKIFAYKVIDGKATSTEIKVLPQSSGTEYVVTDGLEVGDVIVSDGAGLMKEGTIINAKSENK